VLNETLRRRLRDALGADALLESPEALAAYAVDATPLFAGAPAAVALPTGTEQVVAVVRACAEAGVAVVPRGSGTNLSAGTIPQEGAVVLCTARMNRILEIDEANLTASVEPGVVTATLQAAVAARGLYYPPDPGSQRISTLGGNVAENSGGMRCLKYGVTRDYVMGLEVVLADGSVVQTGGKNVKDVAGYDLTRLFVGSEGTLGVVTRILLRLLPAPQARGTVLACFGGMEPAAAAAAAIIGARVVPAALEFLDRATIEAIEAYQPSGLPADAAAVLLIEQDGHPAQVADDLATAGRVCREAGAFDVRTATEAAAADRLWSARRAALPALARLGPVLILEDATVPRSRLAEMVRAIERAARAQRLRVATFGHAGDGNLHPTCPGDARDPELMGRIDRAFEEIFSAALELGGTITGEHGVGLAKAGYLPWRLTPPTLAAMRAVKAALDPHNLFNPGKMFAQARPRPGERRHG
jgi:glycolate oxidase